MTPTTQSIGMMTVPGGVTLRADPAREPCFTIVHHQSHMVNLEGPSLPSQCEKLHTDVNNELQSLEIAADALATFPDAPWELRLELARQCWDEARHAYLSYQLLQSKGGRKGEVPIINQEWGVVCSFDSLAARLAVQNRIFEGGALDNFVEIVDYFRALGDEVAAETMDGIAADEIRHAAFANQWLEQLRIDDPKEFFKALAAIGEVKRITELLRPPPRDDMEPHEIPVNVADRQRAGFAV
jgi:uncharacterized ferritin-like protein (DUF455 family)